MTDAEIQKMRNDRLDCQVVMDGQQAEIEMLRKALSEIADGDGRHDGASFMAIAREALSQST